MQIAQNQALFSLLGVTYGGDLHTYFNLPDLRGRVPVGPTGTASGSVVPGVVLGGKGGVNSVAVPLAQHAHTLSGVKVQATLNVSSEGAGQVTNASAGAHLVSSPPGGTSAAAIYQGAANKVVALAADTISTAVTGNTDAAGSATAPVSVVNPYLGMQFIIATVGMYPMRP
jgi:microcystin-dependent protein